MSARLNIYNVIKGVINTVPVHDRPARITKDTAVIMRTSANQSFDNTLCGWDNWIIYIYTPHSPLQLDTLRDKVRKALYLAGIEITHDMSDDMYDQDLRCYVCSLTCRTPVIFNYDDNE